eukprot:Nk52_evm60s621 gene=Nk52_evmTU60s621
MLKTLCIVFFAALVFTASAADIEEDEGVLVLTNDNFDSAIKDNKYVLVEFYAPWCGHCKALAPEYVKAAAELKDESDIKLAKVDATVESTLGSKFGVKGYPTLKFFANGNEIEYGGGRTASDIVAWIKKKTGPAYVKIEKAEELEKFKDENEVCVVGFFKSMNDEVEELFTSTALSVDDVSFAVVTDAALLKDNNVDEMAMKMFRKFDAENPLTVPEDLASSTAIKDFVMANILPSVVEFTDEVAPKIFGGNIKVHSLMFVDTTNDISALLKWYTEVAEEFKGRMMFIYVDVTKASNNRIVEYFGIEASSVPDYRLIEMGAEAMNKFKPDGKIERQSVVDMLNKFEAGDLEPFYKSEDVPEDWDKAPVKVLVGKNFKEVAYDEEKNVLVEFYAPWCGHCKSLAPIWDQLGEKFESTENVVIAKVDATANEIPDVPVQGFPTIKFFPAGSKTIVDYDGGRDLDALVDFLKKKGVEVEGEDAEEKEEDKKEDHDEL